MTQTANSRAARASSLLTRIFGRRDAGKLVDREEVAQWTVKVVLQGVCWCGAVAVVLGAQLGVVPPLLRGGIDENRMVCCLFGRNGCRMAVSVSSDRWSLYEKGKGRGNEG
jgi:hypothetical protein